MRRPVQPSIYKPVKDGIVIYPSYDKASQVGHNPMMPERPLLGLLPPPDTPAPSPPVRAKLPPPPAGWISTTHAAPAAYPSQLREAHGTYDRFSTPFRDDEDGKGETWGKETRAQAAARLADEIGRGVHRRYDAKEWTLEEAKREKPAKQWLSVERWRPAKPTTGGYTLVCTHASGLQKEHWHKIMRDIIARCPSSPATRFGSGNKITHPYNIQIDDIWMIDDKQHNASVDLNAGLLGDVESWEDSGRDVLNFVLHELPTTLGNVDWEVNWQEKPAPRPKVIGVGHSFGGCAMVHAAYTRPDIFEALFLVDPMTTAIWYPRYMFYSRQVEGYLAAQISLRRRNVWPSAAVARKLLRESEFFAKWDADQFDIYMTHGIVPVDPAKPDGEVVLATPAWCEAVVFTEPDAGGRSWDRLPYLRLPVGWCMAGDSVSTRGDEITHEMVWRAPNSRNERILHSGHLITQEKPDDLAASLWRFLATLNAGEWGVQDTKSSKL